MTLDVTTTERLATLIMKARAEADAISEHEASALDRALACGRLIEQIRQELPKGTFTAWASSGALGVARPAVFTYLRLARNEDAIREAGETSINGARTLLDELSPSSRCKWSSDQIAELRRLHHDDGLNARAAGAAIGMSPSTAARYLSSTTAKAHARRLQAAKVERAQARRALQRERDAAAARQIGGSFGAAYSFVRRALSALADEPAAADAIHALYAAEDELGRLLRSEVNTTQVAA